MNNILFIIIFIATLLSGLYLAYIIRLKYIQSQFIGGRQSKYNNINKNNDIIKDLNKSPRSKSEAAAIKILENITGESFPTINPSWLNGLELDGYNPALKLALEVNGPHHYKWYPNNETYEEYNMRLQKDIKKQKLCKQNKVTLIILPTTIPKHHWRDYLLSRLQDYLPNEYPAPSQYITEQIIEAYQ